MEVSNGFFIVNKQLFKGVAHLQSPCYRRLRRGGLEAGGLHAGACELNIYKLGGDEALALQLACLGLATHSFIFFS